MLNALGGVCYMMCKPLQRRLTFLACSWFTFDSCVSASLNRIMAFSTWYCVLLASVSLAMLSLLFVIAVLTHFRAIDNHANDLWAKGPLACGLPYNPEGDWATVGLSFESRVLLAWITFTFKLLKLRALWSPPTSGCLRRLGVFPRPAITFCCLFLPSRLLPGAIAPAEIKIIVALTTLSVPRGWAGGGQGPFPLAALCPVLPELGSDCLSWLLARFASLLGVTWADRCWKCALMRALMWHMRKCKNALFAEPQNSIGAGGSSVLDCMETWRDGAGNLP